MSFAVSDSIYNIEYGGKNLKTLFAQYKNIFNINYLKMIYEIYRFYKLCKFTKLDDINHNYTIEDFVQNNHFSIYLKESQKLLGSFGLKLINI